MPHPPPFAGPVSKLRLLGDYAHSTRISFIEFVYADSAMAALNCSGALLGAWLAGSARVSRVPLLCLVPCVW